MSFVFAGPDKAIGRAPPDFRNDVGHGPAWRTVADILLTVAPEAAQILDHLARLL